MKWEEYVVHNESIRNMEVIKETYVIAMYTITFATIGIGIQVQNPILFLLPYLILFPFQRIIQNKNCNIQKRAALIAVFGEDIWEKIILK